MDTNIALPDYETTAPQFTPAVEDGIMYMPRLARSDSMITQANKLDLIGRKVEFDGLIEDEQREMLAADFEASADGDCPSDCECHKHQSTQTDKISKHVCGPKSASFNFSFSPRGIVTSLNCAKGSPKEHLCVEHTGANEAVDESTADVMKFNHDAEVNTSSNNHQSTDQEMDFDETIDPSIEGVLSRPQFMDSFRWSEVGMDTNLDPQDYPEKFLKTSTIARAKLSDYKYLRCSFKFRFTTNASKFASGRIRFYVVPLIQLSGSRNSREDNLEAVTAASLYHGVELDLGTADTCELEVPFLAPHSAIDLTRFDYSLFQLRATPLAPIFLGSGSSGRLDINVYASMHNIKLAIPTVKPFDVRYMPDDASYVTDSVFNLGPLTLKNNLFGLSSGTQMHPYGAEFNGNQRFWFKTQTGRTRTVTVALNDISNIFNYRNTYDRNDNNSVRAMEHSGPIDESYVMEEHTGAEAEQQSTGIVSGAMSKISTASGMFKDVPVIGTYARTLSWVTELLGGAAKVFGFSKPTSVAAVQPCTIIPAKNFTNIDGIDNSVVLGSSVNNSIGGFDRFGSSEDEMSIPYVVSRPQMIKSAVWTTSQSRRNIITVIPVTPLYCTRQIIDENQSDDNTMNNISVSRYNITAAGYVASMFKWWRGTMKYRLSFAKTAFHSGRIRVTWHPHKNDPYLAFEATSSHTRIYDIRDSTEIEFEVPYHANQPFRRTRLAQSEADYDSGANGFITVQVENDLVAPEQVSDTIHVLVFQCMSGEDAAFHTPTFTTAYPADLAPVAWDGARMATLAHHTHSIRECERFNCNDFIMEEHSGLTDGSGQSYLRADGDINPTDVIAPTRRMPVHKPGMLVGGECVRSLRALTRRFGLGTVFTRNKGTAEDFVLDTINYDSTPISYNPSDIDSDGNSNGDNSQGDCNATRYAASIISPLSYISRMYRLYAGGRRYKVDSGLLASDAVTTSTIYTASDGFSFQPVDDSVTDVASSRAESEWHMGAGTFRHVTSNHTNQFHEVEVPYQQTTSVAPLVNGLPIHERERPTLHVNVKAPDNGTAYVPIYEAAADDHSFGTLITPPYVYAKGTSVLRRAINASWSGSQSTTHGYSANDIIGKSFDYQSFTWTVSVVDTREGTITAYRDNSGAMLSETFTIWSLIDARRSGQLASTTLPLDALLSVW